MNKIIGRTVRGLGDMITGAALLIVLAAFGVFGTAEPVSGSETAGAFTAAAPATRDYVPAGEPLYALYVPEEDVNWDTGESYSVQGDAILALVDLGAIGAINDGADGFIYPHVGTIGDLGYGTVTVTVDGLRICEDGTTGRCTGFEFDPWSPES